MNKILFSFLTLFILFFSLYYFGKETPLTPEIVQVQKKTEQLLQEFSTDQFQSEMKELAKNKSVSNHYVKEYRKLDTDQIDSLIIEIQDEIEKTGFIFEANKNNLSKNEIKRFKQLLKSHDALHIVQIERMLEDDSWR